MSDRDIGWMIVGIMLALNIGLLAFNLGFFSS